MYTREALSLDECQAAIAAMIGEWKKDASNPPITMAVVDHNGHLLAFASTDGAGPLLGRNCIKKAYTAAMTGSSTKVFGAPRPGEADYAARLKEHGWNVTEYGDPMLFVISGGVCARNPADNTVLGGIGVSGYPYGPGDHGMALVGLRAMGV